jgi:DNA primase
LDGVGAEGRPNRVEKITTSWGMPRDRLLMFADRIDELRPESVLLAEGPVDAVKCDRVPGVVAVASMGKIVSRHQLEGLLRPGVRRVYLALDHDAPAETRKAYQHLFGRVEVRIVHVPARYHDLGDVPLDETPGIVLGSRVAGPGELFFDLGDHA